jgi:hypothetical protein
VRDPVGQCWRPEKTKTPADGRGLRKDSLPPVLGGIARDQAAQPDTAGEQQQAATHDQGQIESRERQDTARIGLRWLGRDAGRSTTCVPASSSACYLPLRCATNSGIGIRSLCERGRSQSEDGNNGCKDADSSD